VRCTERIAQLLIVDVQTWLYYRLTTTLLEDTGVAGNMYLAFDNSSIDSLLLYSILT
jgi:hypothetical protein